jgi:hypothetical protein
MTYRCPSDGTSLVPAEKDPDALFCWTCGVLWNESGNGRLKKADPEALTHGDLARAAEDLED